MPSLHHYDGLGTARFVTFSCYRRLKLLTSEPVLEILRRHVYRLRLELEILILAYVFMPNHVHLVLLPPENIKLSRVIGQMKGRSSREITVCMTDQGLIIPRRSSQGLAEILRPAIWQRRCYDHNCRTTEIVREKINYCHNNPVRWGLVTEPGDWRYSSYNWYRGRRDCPIPIDVIDL